MQNWQLDLLVLSRVFGIFVYNPLLSRKNVPVMVKAGITVLLTIVTVSVMPPQDISFEDMKAGVYVLILLKEGFVGLVIGFVTNMFFLTVQLSGDIMDSQSGLGMSKVMDPGSNIQMSVMGSVIVFMMYLYFFVTNSHLSYIKLFVLSYEILPAGAGSISPDVGMTIVNYFSVVLMLCVKLAMPIIAAQLLTEFCVGILMKSVPQIQIMVINIQLKVGLGFVLLFLLAVPISNFVDKYMDIWLENIENIIPHILQ